MKSGQRQSLWVLVGLLLSIGSAQSAFADDTELFIAKADPSITGAQANIMFIVDTSGSMRNDVVTQVPWDPNTTFTGCYDPAAIYWSTTPGKPGCGSDNYFWADKLHCDAAQNLLDSVGQYHDEFAAWRGGTANRWVQLRANRKNRQVECQDDAGVHGENAGDPEVYAADTQQWIVGPASAQITWNNDYYVWSGNWLNWDDTGGTVTKDRIDVVKEVATNLLNNISGVNVGLMRFNRNEVASESGGPILHAMEDIATARGPMLTKIDNLPASGWTPLSETLYEANQYWDGRGVLWGNVGPDMSVAESRVGGVMSSNTYEDPVEFACQKNYQILLTDGAPTRDTDSENAIEALPQFNTIIGSDCDGSGSGSCLDDLAEYMYRHDLEPTQQGLQNVTTYTIGFTVDLPLLASTASRGGGEYKLADDAGSLTVALTEIVQSILDDATTFTAPSVPVNAFNRTQNLNDVFVSVFQPTGHRHWLGNLKKYRLVGGELVGQDGAPAVDPNKGFFSDTAFSYWSGAPDGDRVSEGGAAHEQPGPVSRALYTNFSVGALNAASNNVAKTNGLLSPAVLGVPDPSDTATRDVVIDHMRGLDVNDEDDDGDTTDQRNVMGDPLHVRPVTVIYGGTFASPDATVFVSTNDGYFHAIDAATGVEKWAFIPTRLLDNMYELYTDPVAGNKDYGLDGNIAAAILNNDFVPGITGAEKVIVVFGMRRGGDSVFALDVTNPNSPVFLWEKDSSDGDFDTLGQTWSDATIAKMNVGGGIKHVAIFGGGYDAGQDNPGYREDSIGNDLYIVDLETGDMLWRASDDLNGMNFDMDHSFPARVTAIDLTGDGLINRMYAGDMGGRLWRFDVINGNSASNLVEGGVIATLGAADMDTPTAADVRRFYAAPDVVAVLSEDTQQDSYLAINLGSGHRAHPLDTQTEDWFFSVRDYVPFDVMDTDDYPDQPVVFNDLVDITNDASPTLTPNAPGWRLALVQDSGEKVVTESFTFQGTVFFTSFSPGGAADSCSAGFGTNRLYRVNVTDGSPEPHPDDMPEPPDDPEPEDRIEELNQGGIAPGPVFFFTARQAGDPSDPDFCVGVECEGSGITNDYTRTYWFQDETQ